MSRHQNTGRHHDLMIANISFENVAKLKYLGMTVSYEYCIHEEIKTRLNSGNTKKLKIVILSVFCTGVKLCLTCDEKNINSCCVRTGC
jgi:hypothetical protein